MPGKKKISSGLTFDLTFSQQQGNESDMSFSAEIGTLLH